jgi:2-dehydro-3-deoxygluconokinase
MRGGDEPAVLRAWRSTSDAAADLIGGGRSAGMKRFDILAIGEPLGELNATRGEPGRYLFGHGGDTSNCAVAAARQGARVAYWTQLGADEPGRSFRALWTAEGVDHAAVATHPSAPTGLYFVSHGPGGHVFDYRRAGSAASLIGPAELPRALLADCRVLHSSGISLAISSSACDAVLEALALAREAGATIAFDTNLRLKLWPLPRARALIHAAAAMADILLPGIDDAAALLGTADPDAIVDRYLAMGPRIVALTLGAGGCLVATAAARLRLPAVPVAAVDATGAGDAFDGAFLAEHLASGDPFAAARYANATAALATTGWGAVAPIPQRAAVEHLLATLPAER